MKRCSVVLRVLEFGSFMTDNCYIVGSDSTGEGVVIDPVADVDLILKCARRLKLNIKIVMPKNLQPLQFPLKLS